MEGRIDRREAGAGAYAGARSDTCSFLFNARARSVYVHIVYNEGSMG
jgi:hypothetical protein